VLQINRPLLIGSCLALIDWTFIDALSASTRRQLLAIDSSAQRLTHMVGFIVDRLGGRPLFKHQKQLVSTDTTVKQWKKR
jgi:hypothetical protein